jgi:putative transposase
MLEYKCTWYGRELITVDRWYPPSKLCSACGALRQSLPLNVREWACSCGITHDRDVNAAINILAAGRADRQNACGGLVRPRTASAGTARLAETGTPAGDGWNPRPSGRGGMSN